MRGLLYYLFTAGLAGEKGLESAHSDARVIAGWDPADALEGLQPPVGSGGQRDFKALASRLNEPVIALGLGPEAVKRLKPVYHLAISAAKDPTTGELVDRYLDDALWADIAREYAGLGAVRQHRGVPLYPETQSYVRRIRTLMATYADPNGSAPGAGPPGSWIRPITGAPITSGFGMRWGRLHAGVDFGAPIGTRSTPPATAPSWPLDRPAATASGSSSATPVGSPPSTDTSAAGASPSAKPSRPASPSRSAATRAAPPDRTCTSRYGQVTKPSIRSPSTVPTACRSGERVLAEADAFPAWITGCSGGLQLLKSALETHTGRCPPAAA